MEKKRRSFGKELEAVLVASRMVLDSENSQSSNWQILKQVAVLDLFPGKFQPRKAFDPESLQELADSIQENGILQPIIVRPFGTAYEIIAGERRWRAAQWAGLQEVPVIICNVNDESALAFGLIENIQRKNLNPMEEAHAFKKLIDEFAMTHEQVAKTVGRSRSMVTNMLRLLNLSEPLQALVVNGELEMGHARALLTLEAELQERLALRIVVKKLTVRETEKLANSMKLSIGSPRRSAEKKLTNKYTSLSDDRAARLAQILSTSVSIRLKARNQGQLIIHFESIEEVDWLIEHIIA